MEFENRYSRSDRLLHRIAFSTSRVQIDLAEFEDRMFSAELSAVDLQPPVFITALPRAGTTLLLDLCAETGEFATHCYRDMPFVLLPLLWNRFSKSFRKSDAPRERAHGDGMLVSVDSPEAFEEMIWKGFWKEQYREDRILPWGEQENPEFLAYFKSHLRKLSLLRRGDGASAPRYISKNNGNIARISWLARVFPGAVIIIPVREVAEQASSLLQQHMNFLDIHSNDAFARSYMAGIGHFDFGENLRPIDFDGWIDGARHRDTRTLNFWVEYWTAAYGHLLDLESPQVHFLSYERFCADAREGLERIADLLSLEDRAGLVAQADGIRPARVRGPDLSDLDASVAARAEAVSERLRACSIT
jgi:hypothetical protein